MAVGGPAAGRLIREGSRFRAAWDFFAVAAVVATGLVIPFQVAFLRDVSFGGSLLVYLLDLFFLVDIRLNLRTTFRAGGVEVVDRGAVASRYRRRELPLDLAGTIPVDALFLTTGLSVGGVPVAILLRLTRLLRVGRFVRTFRRWERLHWTNTGYLRITKLVLGVFLLIHWIACGWFLVSVLEGYPADSWIAAAGIQGLGTGTQYLRSLYWGFVTTTTVGYGDITPSRNAEYAFTILVMVAGASMYALIIGSIASLVSSVDAVRASFWNRVDGISQYLRTRGVPDRLQSQIQDYYEYIWDRYRGAAAQQVLRDLPDSIRLEVVFHLARDLIDQVPLFRKADGALRSALLMALEPMVFVPGSYVVREGEVATGLYFVSSGRSVIAREEEGKVFGELGPGDYFGDLSLLLGERRTASVRALTHMDVFFLSSRDFERLKIEYPEFKDALREIASGKSEKLADLVSEGCLL